MKPIAVICGLVFLFGAQVVKASLHVQVQPVCTAAGKQRIPVIDGDRVVWEDYRNKGPNASDIYLFDLATNIETGYVIGPGDHRIPALWRNLIAWMDYRPGNPGPSTHYDIYTSYIGSGQINASNSVNDDWIPAVSNNIVFWEQEVTWDHADIVGRDLLTLTKFSITNTSTEAREPSVAWPWLAYKERVGGDIYKVWIKNLVTGETLPASPLPFNQEAPTTDGRYVTWEDSRNPATAPDIYLYDLVKRVEIPICVRAGIQEWPHVFGNFVVWSDSRSGDADIYAYDLSTGTEFPVCAAPGAQEFPWNWGGRVVWQDNRNGVNNSDIYSAVITRDWAQMQGIAQAKMVPDMSEVELTGKKVTANFGAESYVEDPDRTSGIRVLGSWGIEPGQTVTVRGVMGTDRGEREIRADEVRVTDASTIDKLAPYAMQNLSVGGTGFDPLIPNITPSSGLHNVGLLVKVWGKVTFRGSGFFYLDDGSTLQDTSGHLGLRVETSGTPPDENKFVVVEGISSVWDDSGFHNPKVIAVSADTVRIINL